ncbi:Holliday junction branch migration protein RuvA [Sulfobacillus thermosulfidooxidans]|uniref:Holliday junction branch migration complex subunit RuvA n=2 Tax=Sulfobacillus thermosulfidooxidans TaxID=28034 RepID=A0A1W1W782_SULTA|nr:Holliday junction branch migration protein RuvA [Sulfobacillus thermosulfidooxidans]OLZ09817.1 Holliday junction DNA helicase RuvA [Sulfobacillus thermosulfidooxidans]OLZ15877.1 Holliday junction DNA helicase RuvA [Sulfobacillus thermosulfidooxidans]OLZ18276.1 Holliday junction DNA helicase RuvA [Sulfobacillus thermosulfidooxidans]PSR25655.1 MAG: Holliday junction branch migration protein RuvA [Sulfobacillus thermosulfidooxidans]SMC01603.1 Holliday junction DNA helicase subunit RuvA [Sulfob
MISEITGIVVHKDQDTCVVNVHGIGFLVETSRITSSQLPACGHEVHLYTHLVVREDNWRLVGFISPEERETFLDLLSVGGLGIKGALSVLSVLGIDGLENAIVQGDWQRIKEAPGVGAKLAQRIQLELSGKWQNRPVKVATPLKPSADEPGDEIVQGLMALGYSREEAQYAAQQVDSQGDVATRIRQALRALDRR